MNRALITSALILQTVLLANAQDVFEAARTGDVGRLELLKSTNEDTLSTKNAFGFTPLIIATYRNQYEAVVFLLEGNVDVNDLSQEGTALAGACYKGNLKIAEVLLNHGADPNLKNGNDLTPLMLAVQSKNPELVSLLIQFNADKECEDNNGFTALEYAQKLKAPLIVEILK